MCKINNINKAGTGGIIYSNILEVGRRNGVQVKRQKQKLLFNAECHVHHHINVSLPEDQRTPWVEIIKARITRSKMMYQILIGASNYFQQLLLNPCFLNYI